MYQIPNQYLSCYKSYINRDNREFEFGCTIEGNPVSESDISSIYIEHDLISGAEEYTIGNLASAKLTITIASNVSINEGDRIDITVYLKTEEVDNNGQIIKVPVPMGRFYAFNIKRTKLSKTIEAYDDLYKSELEESYKSGYIYTDSSPAKIHNILGELCKILNIGYSLNIPNEDLYRPEYVSHIVLNNEGNYVEVESDSNQVCFGMSVGQALSYIAAYLKGNFIVDGDRNLKLIRVNTREFNVVKTYEANEYTSPTYEEASYKINTVYCTSSTGEVLEAGDNTFASFSFENPFYDKSRLAELLNTLNKIEYKPIKVKVKGDPTLQPGDMIKLNPIDFGSSFLFPALRMKISFTGGCSIDLEAVCKAEPEKNINYKGTISSRIDALEGSITKLGDEIDELSKSLKTLSNIKEDIDDIDKLIDTISNDVSSDKLEAYNTLLRRIETDDVKFNEQYLLILNNKYLK